MTTTEKPDVQNVRMLIDAPSRMPELESLRRAEEANPCPLLEARIERLESVTLAERLKGGK